jgi:LPXTG-site transpeptidase (sortase) family protein
VRRSHPLGAFAIAAAVLVGAGCTASDGTTAEPAAPREQPAPAVSGLSPSPPDTRDPGSSLAGATRSLPPATPLPAETPDLPPPTGLTIDDLDIARAPVVPVGVEANGDMEIPGAAEVGWYRYGPRPGDDGSAVLAAHVAYDGVDGVFRHLDDVAVGAMVTVDLADGESTSFVVTGVERYPKDALPDEVFARTGDAGLVLITCGGRFDSQARSYEDNVVVYTRPA